MDPASHNVASTTSPSYTTNFNLPSELGSNQASQTRNPLEFFILIAPAVSFLVVLGNRQSRISVIIRDNCKRAEQSSENDKFKATLHSQNEILFLRFIIIKIALISLCLGLLVMGAIAWDEYFHGSLGIFFIGVFVMGIGTGGIVYELSRGGDALFFEMRNSQWDGQGDSPEFNDFVVFKPSVWAKRILGGT